MRVLLTGGSSFTGYWFAKALVEAGHELTCTLQGALGSYFGVQPRGERVRRLALLANVHEETSFGDPKFLRLVDGRPDVIAHHGALVKNYRSPDFDLLGAVAANTRNCREVLTRMASVGSSALVISGTLFEPREGLGTEPDTPITAYGVSKGLTSDIFRWYAREVGVRMGKFVMPNPFGPLEEERFCRYAYQCWLSGEVATVNFPAYVRDNIHVGLLARAYVRYLEDTAAGTSPHTIGPSGYVETQANFAQRLSREVGTRLGLRCELAYAEHIRFDEPRIRVNATDGAMYIGNWHEERAWDEVAEHVRLSSY